jgi:hypothetical protein
MCRIPVSFSLMKRARAVLEDKIPAVRRKVATEQSERRLRKLYDEAQRTTDARKKEKLKEDFIREFYQGAD